jgi:diguanylate cyclase (GGDEF)-like protein/PAS domain S-box-containing protein
MTRDAVGVITSVDATIVEMLGWRPEQWIGSKSTTFLHPEDQASGIATWLDMITSPGTTRVWRGRYQTADGEWAWVETVNRLEESDTPVVVTTMTRVTVDQVSTEEELRAREQLLSRLSDALPVGLFEIDVTGHVRFTNDRLHSILGVVPKATVEAQLSTVVANDRPILQKALAAVLGNLPVDDVEIRLDLANGDVDALLSNGSRVCLLSLRALTDGAGVVSGAVGCLSDVTESVQLRQELEMRASVDELTSCLNRAATLELLEQTVRAPALPGQGSAVVFIDLDRFKSVNDRFGHAAGDGLLVAAADRLRGAVRDCDYIGRFGGDEFLVICPGVESPPQAIRLANRIAMAITATVDVGPATVELHGSVGVAWTSEALQADAFIAQADCAMYESKRTGRGGVTLFKADQHHRNLLENPGYRNPEATSQD